MNRAALIEPVEDFPPDYSVAYWSRRETIDRVGQSVNSRIPQRIRQRQEFLISEFSGGESGIVTAASELASFISVQP